MMKRLGLMVAALAVALSVGIVAGTQGPSQAQEEEPVELGNIFFVNPSVCLALTMSIGCQNGAVTSTLSLGRFPMLGAFDANGDGETTREEINRFNRSGNQIHNKDGSIVVVVFVEDDEPIRFDTNKGFWRVDGSVSASDFLCNVAPVFPFANQLTADEDCDDDGIPGDGILLGQLIINDGTSPGPGQVRIIDEGDGEEVGIFNFLVTDEPHSIVAAPFETTLGAGIDADDPNGCPLPTTVAGFTEALGNANKAVVIARAETIDGENIIGAWTGWSVEAKDADKVKFGAPETPTLDLGSFGFGAPQVICGLEGSGEVEVTIKFLAGPLGLSAFDPQHRPDDVKFTVTLGALPAAIDFTVTPAVLTCDGVASAEVAASVTDVNGDPVVNGTEVRFDVQVLGIANPINATTTDGVAKTTVTPLAIQNTGVPVIATVGEEFVSRFRLITEPDGVDNDNDGTIDESTGEIDITEDAPNPDRVEDSTIVQCGAGSAPVDPAQPQPGEPGAGGGAGGGQTGVIRGPDTGSGGNAAPSPMSAWPAVALFAGAMALAGARFALRRA